MSGGRVFEAQVATTGREVRAILQKSLLSISDLYMKLYTHSGGILQRPSLGSNWRVRLFCQRVMIQCISCPARRVSVTCAGICQ